MLQRKVLIAAVFMGVAAAAEAGGEPVALERALIRQAPSLIKTLREKGYKSVGVLKFLAVDDRNELTDNVGTLNMLMAQRLETALLLANRPKDPMGIIENASAVAQTIPEASYLRKKTRQKLFQAKYSLAWGNKQVRPDVFVTGVVKVSHDLELLTISLMAFDRTQNELAPIAPDFVARNRPQHLVEFGQSFAVRGAFDKGLVNVKAEPVEEEAKAQTTFTLAHNVKTSRTVHPVQDPDAPVRLEIHYGGKAVPIQVRNGVARVAEPQEGQAVEIFLRRNASKERLKAVLKVNGENTLGKQRLPDVACRGWVLEPANPAIKIRGYQINANTVEKFRVLSRIESKPREVNYGADVGMITLTVFRERQGEPVVPNLLDDEEMESQIVANAVRPKKRPDNFGALKASLFADANRGLIAEGDRVVGKIRFVPFNLDPTPVMSLAVKYYDPQRDAK